MAINPVFSYAGPDSRSIPIGVIFYKSAIRQSTRGVFRRQPLTRSTVGDPLTLSGTTAWFSLPFSIDEKTIEFVVPNLNGAGFSRTRLHLVIRAQRHYGSRTAWDTVEAILSDAQGAMAGAGDFSPVDYSPDDYFTG